MGILNVTPDSFAEWAPVDPGQRLDAALEMEAAGADLIDVGGESTRPGAGCRSPSTRNAPRRSGHCRHRRPVRVPMSVDTYKAQSPRGRSPERGGDRQRHQRPSVRRGDGGGRSPRQGQRLVLMHTRGRLADHVRRTLLRRSVGDVESELQAAIDRATAPASRQR